MEMRREGARDAVGFTGFERAALGAPFGTAAGEDADVGGAHRLEFPPDARRREQASLVVKDDGHAVADAERTNGVGEGRGRQQHMRQVGGLVRDAVDVEEGGTRKVRGEVFLARPPVGVGQEPAAVEERDVRVAEASGEPVGRNEDVVHGARLAEAASRRHGSVEDQDIPALDRDLHRIVIGGRGGMLVVEDIEADGVIAELDGEAHHRAEE